MRTLHIGNIANNAYLACLKEREIGIDAHCVSPSFTQVMGFPEWEQEVISRKNSSQFYNNISERTYIDPPWFHSGSWLKIFSEFGILEEITTSESRVRLKTSILLEYFWVRLRASVKEIVPAKARAFVVGTLLQHLRDFSFQRRHFRQLINQFDYISLYGPYSSLGKYFENKQFIAFEHGTLRNFIEAPYKLARDAKSGFISAAAVIVTNQDCLPLANLLNQKRIFKSPHPIKDDDTTIRLREREDFLTSTQSVTRILVPARHTIPLNIDIGKGSETIYESISRISLEYPNVKFDLVKWGDNLERAIKELRPFEKKGFVEWHDLMSRPALVNMMVNSTAVIDQLSIPAYGGIAMDCLRVGTPLITSHDCKLDIDFFGSCAPVFGSANADDIISNIKILQTLDIAGAIEHMNTSANWYKDNMRSDISLEIRLQIYESLEKSKKK